MKRPLALTGFTMLGTLFAFLLIKNVTATGAALTATLVAVLLGLAVKPLRRHREFILILLSASVALSLLLLTQYNTSAETARYTDAEVTVTGSLEELPYTQYGRHYYIIGTDFIDGEAEKLRVRISSSDSLNLAPGDIITLKLKLYLLGRNDDRFTSYYLSEGMIFGGYTVDAEGAVTEKGAEKSITQLVLKIREMIRSEINSVEDAESSAVICAMLLGDKSELGTRADNAFRICGIAHLFAVSGLHLSVWSALVWQIIAKLGLSRKKAGAGAIAFSVFFMLLTGFNPPVVRAGFMMIMIYAAEFFSREADPYNSMGFAVAVMLIANPYTAMSVSLWLSLLATLGIITAANFIISEYRQRSSLTANKLIGRLADTLVQSLAISLSVTVFTLPVYVFIFGSISLLTPIANLLTVFIGSVCMVLSGFGAVLSLVHLKVIGWAALRAAGMVAHLLLGAALKMSELRYALIPVNSALSVTVMLVSLAAAAVILAFRFKNKRIIRITAATLAAAFIAVNVISFTVNFNRLTLTTVGGESGYGAVIRCKGKTAVISTELDRYESYTFDRCIDALGVSCVDYLILMSEENDSSDTTSNRFVRYVASVGDTAVLPVSQSRNIGIPSRIILGDNAVMDLYRDHALISFYQTEIVFLFQDDIILDNLDPDMVIGFNKPSGYIHGRRVIVCSELDSPYYTAVCRDGRIIDGRLTDGFTRWADAQGSA